MLAAVAAGLLTVGQAQNTTNGPHDLLMLAFNQLKTQRSWLIGNPLSSPFAGGEVFPGTAMFGGLVKPGEKLTFAGSMLWPGSSYRNAMLTISTSRGRAVWKTDILESMQGNSGPWNPVRKQGMGSFQLPVGLDSTSYTITLDGPTGPNALPEFVLVTVIMLGPPAVEAFGKFEQQFRAAAAPLLNLQREGYNWKSGQISFVANWRKPNDRFLQALPLLADSNVVLVSNGSIGKTNWSNNIAGDANALEITGDSGFQVSKPIAKNPDHFISAKNLSDRQQLIAISTLSK